MKITRLRLVGFKSFVDSAEVFVAPGLTGVVGPNGCGKSNLVEALRWVMGESSHKALRAAEMSDVIFAGSAGRPSRNTAEVLVVIDNAEGLAPAPYATAEVLEVARRIERDRGSTYRVNGREVRARDVQLLFADASTGARSPALVRQGQIGEIINAKPEARRRVLEEAAGIAGLHARRHEAELRLRTAEQNLDRVDDVLGRMRVQLEGLKRQARQATRYRALSAEIRRVEAVLLTRAERDAAAERASAERALADAEREVAERTLAQSEAARAEALAAQALAPRRDAAAAAAAALERLRRAGQDLDREERDARERLAEVVGRLGQLEADLGREAALARDAADSLGRLATEDEALLNDDVRGLEAERKAAERLAGIEIRRNAAEAALAEATAAVAERSARGDALSRRRTEARARLGHLTAEHARAAADLAALERAEPAGLLDRRTAELTEAEQASAAAEAAAAEAEGAILAAREAEAAARQLLNEAETALRRLEVEAATLAKLLAVDARTLWPPLIDRVEVARGYEAALGAALGDDLDAPDDAGAPVHWVEVAPGDADPLLPADVAPLAGFVAAPPALARRVAQIGVVARPDGARLQASLRAGQRLVSREGDLWRWDGFVAAADAPSAAARRLDQRNRLAELEEALVGARRAAGARRQDWEDASARLRQASDAEREARDRLRGSRRLMDEARALFLEAEREADRRETRRGALAEAVRRLAGEEAEARRTLAEAEADHQSLPPAAGLESERDRRRATAERERAAAADARAAAQALTREREARGRRREAVASERKSWQTRSAGASDRLADIETRRAEAIGERARLEGAPEEIAGKRRALLSAQGDAEAEAKSAADRLAEAEGLKSRADEAAREALRTLAGSRETLVREEGRRDAARARHAEAAHRLSEAGGAGGQPSAAENEAPVERLSAELERLRGEREKLGAVNLRADAELAEVQASHDALGAEQDDLVEAIKRLRQGIQSLNREGRERLGLAFEAVNGHFKRLFETLFGGGDARLELIESEDPLEAGLEVVARPPGKRPQTLSLLSGGEQALTAMALIFAIFLTNPAPICVLDEVDAPLDDANVERFCDLLDAMVKDIDTRFLVVTHNPVTMSRMDRLFGVTMAERGVSQLVSVDLDQAERLREAV